MKNNFINNFDSITKNQDLFYYCNDKYNDNVSETNCIVTSITSEFIHIKLNKTDEKIRINKKTGFRDFRNNEIGSTGSLYFSKSDYLNYIDLLEKKKLLISRINKCFNLDTINRLIGVMNVSENNNNINYEHIYEIL